MVNILLFIVLLLEFSISSISMSRSHYITTLTLIPDPLLLDYYKPLLLFSTCWPAELPSDHSLHDALTHP